MLFKDEVRKLGLIMDVPPAFIQRHPFPGPGLAVRVLGDVCARVRWRPFVPWTRSTSTASKRRDQTKSGRRSRCFCPSRAWGAGGPAGLARVGLRHASSDGMTADW